MFFETNPKHHFNICLFLCILKRLLKFVFRYEPWFINRIEFLTPLNWKRTQLYEVPIPTTLLSYKNYRAQKMLAVKDKLEQKCTLSRELMELMHNVDGI